MTPPRTQIGIDENGLGPLLGPMIVTAARLDVDPARVPTREAFVRATREAGIGDSKQACSHGAMGAVEGRVRALLAVHLEAAPASLEALTHAFAIDDAATLRRHCPTGHAPVACFAEAIHLPAFGGVSTDDDHAAAHTLRSRGVTLTGVRVGIVCAKQINLAREAGQSRFDLDLVHMVALTRALGSGGQTLVLCGKVGGRMRYAPALETLSPLVGVLHEHRERSSYAVPGVGEMHFVLDGDDSEPAIGLASMIGKYVRELWMHRINRYWADAVPGLTPVSGYHDPNTAKFIERTALVRRERDVPDVCFRR